MSVYLFTNLYLVNEEITRPEELIVQYDYHNEINDQRREHRYYAKYALVFICLLKLTYVRSRVFSLLYRVARTPSYSNGDSNMACWPFLSRVEPR